MDKVIEVDKALLQASQGQKYPRHIGAKVVLILNKINEFL